MKAKKGIYGVYGNHDVEEELFGGFAIKPVSEAFRYSDMENFIAESGIKILADEIIEIEDGKLVLAGRIDGGKAGDGTANRMSAAELLAGISPEKKVLVMEHEPYEYDELSAAGADIVFSGHTYRGQIFPGNLVVGFFNDNAYGY